MEIEKKQNLNIFTNLKYDLPAGLVVFLVALPLCLGIALASGAPLFSGILAGIVGGLVIPIISRSSLSVSGPAAGLTAIVLSGIERLGSFEIFLAAGVIGGLVQLVLGLVRAGSIAYFFPSSIIKGMLAAIGLILILKQLPHAIGYDAEQFGLQDFLVGNGENTFTLLGSALTHIEVAALIISLISLTIMIIWEKTSLKNFALLPAALVVVIVGTLLNLLFLNMYPEIALAQSHLVNLPVPKNGPADFLNELRFPNWNGFMMKEVWIVGLTIGIVASIESLLSVEAVDQLDPYKRKSPLNRELLAQGAGNVVSGLIGGLPITAVIVRSSANIAAGGRTRMAAIMHGLFLALAVVFISKFLNYIPLASLAAVLLMVGYKLTKPAMYVKMRKEGLSQFLPFIITVVAILLTDLLVGISIGLVVGVFFVIKSNYQSAFKVKKEEGKYVVKFRKDVSFLNKASLVQILNRLPDERPVVIDCRRCEFMDHDIREIIENYKYESELRGNDVELRGLSDHFIRETMSSH
ncbi:MAG: SulP family inorganic anion transporter [Bacteroidia bacterium]